MSLPCGQWYFYYSKCPLFPPEVATRGGRRAGVCSPRAACRMACPAGAPLNARGTPTYCYQLPPATCEQHFVEVAFALYACKVAMDVVLGPRCKVGPRCLGGSHSRPGRRRWVGGGSVATLGKAGQLAALALRKHEEEAPAPHGASPLIPDDCADLANLPAVFIVALGRTGSSQLLRLLNGIPGYRISGETDNAWLYLARNARASAPLFLRVGLEKKPLRPLDETPVCETWPPFDERASARAQSLTRQCERKPLAQRGSSIICRRARAAASDAQRCHTSVTAKQCMQNARIARDCPVACFTCRPAGVEVAYRSQAELCSARRLLVTAHNPAPRARVFGFKEIYSPWIRNPEAIDEVIDGIGFLRTLFPRAKVIFHWRDNLTRVASSDFWQLDRSRNESASHFARVVDVYRSYIKHHPDHAFGTTLEGVTGRKRFLFTCTRSATSGGSQDAHCLHSRRSESQIDRLFNFLNETLEPKLRNKARENPMLLDWSEEKHTRRIGVRLPNGSIAYQLQSFAWETSAQNLGAVG